MNLKITDNYRNNIVIIFTKKFIMTLIKSISGIRGTLGGEPNENLTPVDIVKYTSAYGHFLKYHYPGEHITVVVGRDARVSGKIIQNIVVSTLQSMGIDVYLLGLATTPTTEIAVTEFGAHGGIIITASHNPFNWNALKLLNNKGEFLSENDGKHVLLNANTQHFKYVDSYNFGKLIEINNFHQQHIKKILNLDLVNVKEIKKAKFTVAIDGINSVGGIVIPELLKKLGVKKVLKLNCTANGLFKHNPEPLPENLTQIISLIKRKKIDVGFVVDPDVDRLAIVCEDGTLFGEEYTLVAVADYVLQHKPGNTVSNLSSTMALKEITEKYKQKYFAAPVGEVNVVEKMKEVDAVIGGEGNGGIIYPELHYGRDALVGIALFLSYLATSGLECSELRKKYPFYPMAKKKIEITDNLKPDFILEEISKIYSGYQQNKQDGLKIYFSEGWLHMRKSNTEPIIRIYAEAKSNAFLENILNQIEIQINAIIKNYPD